MSGSDEGKTDDGRALPQPAEVHVSDEVIAAFAAEAALATRGVLGLGSGGAVQATKNLIGRADAKVRGVRVSQDPAQGASIDVFLIVSFGTNIPETAWNVQRRIAQGLRESAQLKLKEVNIHVQGVSHDDEKDRHL